MTLDQEPIYKKAFEVSNRIISKKLNTSESVKSISIEKKASNPIALTIDSIDVHNSTAVIELQADLNHTDSNLINFNPENVKAMLLSNQNDFEDIEAEKIKIEIDNVENEITSCELNQSKTDFLSFNLEQSWKQNIENISKNVKHIKDEYRNSITNFIRRFK